MRKIYKTAICAVIFLLLLGQTAAQQSRHEFTVNGGLGLSTLSFGIANGEKSNKTGGQFGIGYSYFFNDNFGLATGLEIASYTSDVTMNNFTDSYSTHDGEENFVFNTRVSGYSEKQNALYLNIPVMGQYQISIIKEHRFYGGLGLKIGLPLNASYETSGSDIVTSGTFPNISGTPTIENDPLQGFTGFKGRSINEDLELNVACLLALEAGVKWKLTSGISLYTGAFVDYGLNDIRKEKDSKFLVYEPPYSGTSYNQWEQNSILISQLTGEGKTQSVTDKVAPIAAGLKVKLSFSLAK